MKAIQEAVKYLAGVCDYASTHDGQGFNFTDAGFGHSLARQDKWTFKQAEAAKKMLRKYEGQLKRAGMQTSFLHEELVAQQLPAKKVERYTKFDVVNQTMRIFFSFDWDVLNTVKTIPGRKFEPRKKYWYCPVSQEAVDILNELKFEIAPEIVQALKVEAVVESEEIPEVAMPELKRELFPFQMQGVSFIEAKKGRVLIGDEMGLGKTIQALAWLALHPEKRPVVIVVPAHLKFNWANEIKKTLPGNINSQILFGKNAAADAITEQIIIINYDILDAWTDTLKAIKPQVLIMDEAHYIKNNKAKRTKAVKNLAKGVPHVIALTGTPIINRPIEGFNIAQIINHGLFPNFWEYTQKYCDAKHNGFGWDFSGASNTKELHKILTKSIMIRRKKADVLPELPDKIYSYIPVEMDDAKAYQKAEEDFLGYLLQEKGIEAVQKAGQAEHLVRIEALKQLCVKGKMSQVINWIRDFLNENGNKLVVFAVHKMTIDALMAEFKEIAVKIDGGVSAEERAKVVEAFQNDPSIRLFIGNIKAAGTGLTLTAASSVAFLELPWTPGELLQAEDRCHRIGTKNAVNVYYLLAENTIEMKIAELLDKKREVLDAVLDGKEVSDSPLLLELVNAYKERD